MAATTGLEPARKLKRSKKPKHGVAQIQFNPVEKAEHVKALAISLECEGGVPKKEGPILLVGTT
jgi:anti-sigma-K factor RskA